jgi:hypothetical protein
MEATSCHGGKPFPVARYQGIIPTTSVPYFLKAVFAVRHDCQIVPVFIL